MKINAGKFLLLGSGETSHAGGLAFEQAISGMEIPFKIRILETPAGFELNSEKVAGRIASYMKLRLQNYQPEIQLVPARKNQGEFSTNSTDLSDLTAEGDLLFLGPGSPSYTIRQLENSLLYETLQSVILQGGVLALASAATIAFGKYSLPVYEIYKVGEDPYWKSGLNLLSIFGLEVSFIPHWNNSDGGSELDTSHCFIGKERFKTLAARLPENHPIIGLDERTSLLMDFSDQTCRVIGPGQIHILLGGEDYHYSKNEEFPIHVIGQFRAPNTNLLNEKVWSRVENLRAGSKRNATESIPENIHLMVFERQKARDNQDWETADLIREQLENAGWRVVDTFEGPKIEPIV